MASEHTLAYMNLTDERELRANYAAKLPGQVARLRELAESLRGNPHPEAIETVRGEAHRIKGTSGSYGYPAVSDSARRVEALLKNGSDGIDWPLMEAELDALTAAARAAPSTAEHVEVRRATEPKVLLVDASTAEQRSALALAGKQLVELHCASRIDDALELASRIDFDAALIDSGIGVAGDPYRLARQLRALPGREELPIGVTSTDETVANRVAAAHAGAAVFVTKPLTRNSFDEAVNTLLALHRRARPRVLCVDDDPAFRRWLGDVLGHDGLEVHTLPDSAGLMEALGAIEPDALVLDFELPGFSGAELCAMLRGNRRWKDLPIVFVTAIDDVDNRLAAYEAGCDDYVIKPVLAPELVTRLRARVERHQLLRARVERDAVTGLTLRSVFINALEARLSEAKRRLTPLAVCLIDLDHFKRVNDQYGHLAGDRVLAHLGRLLATRFRGEDLRCRWGGEEFALAFPAETAETIHQVMERVLEEFAGEGFEGDRGESFHATFSAGVAEYPRDGVTLEDLVRLADRRLYRAKANGRRRIESGEQ